MRPLVTKGRILLLISTSFPLEIFAQDILDRLSSWFADGHLYSTRVDAL
jgi:hypothetical protein